VEALGKIDNPSAVQGLTAAARADASPEVRQAAEKALAAVQRPPSS